MPFNNDQKKVSASDLGLSAVTLAAQRTSNWVHVGGRTDVTVLYKYTFNAATDLVFTIESSDTNGASADAYPWEGEADAQTATQIVGTLKPYVLDRPVTASVNGRFNLRVNEPYIRIKVSGTSGGSSDIISVALILGAMSA